MNASIGPYISSLSYSIVFLDIIRSTAKSFDAAFDYQYNDSRPSELGSEIVDFSLYQIIYKSN